MLGWALQRVKSPACLVQHRAARLGVDTYKANNHVIETLNAEGAAVKRVVRDSTAERPYRKGKSKRTHTEMLLGISPPPIMTSSSGLPRAGHACADNCGSLARRSRPAPGSRGYVTRSAAAAKKRRASLTTDDLRQQAANEASVALWLRTRCLSASSQPSAKQRLLELKASLQAKAAAR